jgi:hypothetical protein
MAELSPIRCAAHKLSERCSAGGQSGPRDALGCMHEAHDDHAARGGGCTPAAGGAEVAREAIEKQLPARPDGRLSFFAVGDGSPQDASERVDELVGKSVRRRRAGRR